MTRGEEHVCPRRGEGPQITKPPDHWVTDSWSLNHDRLQHEQETLAGGGTSWRWPWQPRTCSFCGSIHPEDVLRLLEEGWEHERAKSYKGYLNPPGYAEYSKEMMEYVRRREPIPKDDSRWSPVPCAKFYTMHFSSEQLQRLNQLI